MAKRGIVLDTTPSSPAGRERWRGRLADLARRAETGPNAAMLIWGVWGATRLALLLAVVLGGAWCDPQFYHYAGEFAVGHLPYRDMTAEYPPVAVLLLILPALPLLAFASVAPRPDPAFTPPFTHLPHPDPTRYGPYAVSFAVEMLLIDALSLALVLWTARRLSPRRDWRLRAGLLYTLATFATGAILQKFDLAAGSLCLLALALLVARRQRLAWVALALAALVKGFPLLVAPALIAYPLMRAESGGRAGIIAALQARFRVARGEILGGVATFALVIAAWTLLVAAFAGWGPIAETIFYHTGRGTEIESLYANAMLAVGWLPGLAVATKFHGADLSRVILSPLDHYTGVAAAALLAALLFTAYGGTAVALSRRVRGAPSTESAPEYAPERAVILGAVLALLAFMLSFRALPTHYLLMVAPLLAVLRLPTRRLDAAVLAAVFSVALLGQYLTTIWHTLVLLEVWPVVILTARNAAWVALFVLLALVLWGWRSLPLLRTRGERGGAVAGTIAPPRPPIQTPSRRRGIAGVWGRLRSAAPPIPGFTPRSEDVFAHLLSRVSPLHLLAFAGIFSALIYVGFVLAFPITRWWGHPRLAIDMGKLTHYSPFAVAGYVFAILALVACQFLALSAAGRLPQVGRGTGVVARLGRLAIFAFPVAFVLVMIWMQPITTTDLYGYVARGYLFTHLHQNPMIEKAMLLPGGLAVDRPAAPYGPLWLLIAAGVSRIAGENLLANMLLFKLVAALAALSAMALLDSLARALFPARRLRIFVLFAWSPLLLFEAIGNGHNDIVMMLVVLLAFASMLRGRARTAFALLVIGALIKYVSLILAPFWLVYELRRRAGVAEPHHAPQLREGNVAARLGRRMRAFLQTLEAIDRREVAGLLLGAALVGVALIAACYAPFWVGMRTFTGLGQQLRPLYYNGSLVQFVAAPLELLVPPRLYPALDKTVRLVFYLLFAIYAALQTRRLWMRGPEVDLGDVLTASAKTIFAALLLITFWFQPWYIVWLLPLAALARASFVRRQSIVLAAGALFTYAISNYLPIGTSGIGRDLFVQFFEVLVTFAPLLLLRTATYEEGWLSVVRRYLRLAGEGLRLHPRWWERAMLGLILVVAALLRLLRLGNPFAILPSGSASGALRELGADLKLYLADPRGLHGPFVAMQGLMVRIFGHTAFAALLPDAVIGTLTVLVIYLLAFEVTRQSRPDGLRGVALIAALFAATSGWHVSLSRSGMEVVLLPLLVSTGVYWLLRGLRSNAEAAVARQSIERMANVTTSGPLGRLRVASRPTVRWLRDGRVPRPILYFAGCGVCTGLACDLAPGLWLLPLLVAGVLLVWRLRLPVWFVRLRGALLTLLGAALISGFPTLWTFLNGAIGFPAGSFVLAHSPRPLPGAPPIISAAFWAQVGRNLGTVLQVLARQDYSAGYPASGGTPILPAGTGWLFFLGVALILWRWRDLTSMALLLLLALPLLASVAVGAPTGLIVAAAVLPATCIVPALALHAVAQFLGHLPIVLDRINGARVFMTPEQIGRVLLLVFLVISTIRTFFWYFEATLPSTPPNGWIPT